MTPQAERIRSLDVLRGLGILGILAVNAPFFAQPFGMAFDPELLGPLDAKSEDVWAVVRVFFERKFVTLFSMLFGASILLVGGEKGDAERSPVLTRRLCWLLLFGALHGALIWYGDILLTYAIAGLIAAQFRSMSLGKLFGVGFALYFAFALLEAASYAALAVVPAEYLAGSMPFLSPEAARAEIANYRGDLATVQAQAFTSWASFVSYTVGYIPSTIGLMFVGMGLYKTGVFAARRGFGLYLLLTILGAAALAALWWATMRELAAPEADKWAEPLRSTLNAVLAPAVTLGYVSLICLILKTPLRLLTAPLAATGQMAFTNYLTQSLIMTTIFYGGRGLGLFGTMTLYEQAQIVVAIWVVQLVWSPIWMRFFHYGPFEWIWRSLTIKRPAPFLRRPSPPAAAA